MTDTSYDYDEPYVLPSYMLTCGERPSYSAEDVWEHLDNCPDAKDLHYYHEVTEHLAKCPVWNNAHLATVTKLHDR